MTDDTPTDAASRRHQMFPVLTDAEIARIRRFGTPRRYARGERLYAAGQPVPGMFVLTQGHVAISLRDGLGHVEPFMTYGPVHFLRETSQLSGRHAHVD